MISPIVQFAISDFKEWAKFKFISKLFNKIVSAHYQSVLLKHLPKKGTLPIDMYEKIYIIDFDQRLDYWPGKSFAQLVLNLLNLQTLKLNYVDYCFSLSANTNLKHLEICHLSLHNSEVMSFPDSLQTLKLMEVNLPNFNGHGFENLHTLYFDNCTIHLPQFGKMFNKSQIEQMIWSNMEIDFTSLFNKKLLSLKLLNVDIQLPTDINYYKTFFPNLQFFEITFC